MHGSKPEHPNSPRLQQMSSATAAAQPRRDGKERVRERGRCVRGVVWCVWCVADVCRWVPVMFISSVVLWSYYAYTVELCFKAVDNLLQRTLYLLCYHVLFVLFTWSYARTIFTDPGFPQKRFYLTASQLDSLTRAQTEEEEANVLKVVANSLPLLCRQVNGGVRYCKVCVVVKPDRCHHCSICRRCVLKMDHHCPWVNNCVGFHNYKLFLLFLFYASLYCFYVSLSDLPFFIHYWQLTNSSSQQVALGHRMQIIFLGLVASMFILGVFSLLCYHIFLLLHNRTTIESFRLPVFVTGDSQSRRGFGIGWKNNFIQVFGSQPKYWLLPVASSMGNGNTFPVAQREPESGFLLREDYCHEDTGSDRGEMFGFGSAPLVGVPLASVPPTGKLSLLEEEDANSGDHQLEEILNGAHSHSLHKLSTASSCSGDSSSANSEKKLVNHSQHHHLQHHHQQQNQNQKQLNDYSVDLLGLPNSANPKNEHSFESLDKELTEDMA